MTIQVDTLIDAFSDSVGQERARDIVTSVCEDMGHDAPTCTETEAIEVAVRVANQRDATPFVRTAAQTVQTRIQAGHLE